MKASHPTKRKVVKMDSAKQKQEAFNRGWQDARNGQPPLENGDDYLAGWNEARESAL